VPVPVVAVPVVPVPVVAVPVVPVPVVALAAVVAVPVVAVPVVPLPVPPVVPLWAKLTVPIRRVAPKPKTVEVLAFIICSFPTLNLWEFRADFGKWSTSL
jgi:signal-induced proliferation-associated 1 like protein 3